METGHIPGRYLDWKQFKVQESSKASRTGERPVRAERRSNAIVHCIVLKDRETETSEHLENCTGKDELKANLRVSSPKDGTGSTDVSGRRAVRDRNESNGERSSKKEHRADAMAPIAEEGRSKLRKALGSRKQA